MFVLQTTENSEKRVVEIQQTKLNSHYKQIKTSECWKPWQEGSKSNATNYSLWAENYIFWKSSSQKAHPLGPRLSHIPTHYLQHCRWWCARHTHYVWVGRSSVVAGTRYSQVWPGRRSLHQRIPPSVFNTSERSAVRMFADRALDRREHECVNFFVIKYSWVPAIGHKCRIEL